MAMLEKIIKSMVIHASHLGMSLTQEKTLNPKAKIIINKRGKKVGVIGESLSGNIKFFKINIRKWMWAAAEGFSMEDINKNKLKKEVFQEVPLESPIDNFQIAKMVKELK